MILFGISRVLKLHIPCTVKMFTTLLLSATFTLGIAKNPKTRDEIFHQTPSFA